jgi:hypothetical protein
LELYTYAEYFEDDLGQLFPMLPENLVLLASTNVQNKIVYGAYTQLEDAKAKRYVTYQTARIPFIYGDEENGHLFYRLTSCPLPMPNDILAFTLIDALAPVVRSGDNADPTRVPYLKHLKGEEGKEGEQELTEGTDHTPQEESDSKHGQLPGGRTSSTAKGESEGGDEHADLDEMTVEELRQHAEEEGIDLKGATHKADIQKAIKRHRKSNK